MVTVMNRGTAGGGEGNGGDGERYRSMEERFSVDKYNRVFWRLWKEDLGVAEQ